MKAVAYSKEHEDRAEREQTFAHLYEQGFPIIARFVSQMGGTLPEAKDIFQDALVIYWEKSREEEFVLQTSQHAYILGIAKHLWNRRVKQEHRKVSLSSSEAAINIPEDYFPSVNSLRLLAVLERSGKKCLDLLRAFYYQKLPMKQIAGAFGYGTDRSATVQKYKCLEKVRETIKEKSIGYEDFLN